MIKHLLIYILLVIIAIELNSQIPQKIDYIIDIEMHCDSIEVFEYKKISDEEWKNIAINDNLTEMSPKYKQVLYYKDSLLHLEKNYSKVGNVWNYDSKVTYDIKGSNIKETTSAILGDKEFSLSESYDLNYLWITKIVPMEILPADEANKVLFDPEIKRKYDIEITKIKEGNIELKEGEQGEKIKVYRNIDGKVIREEKLELINDQYKFLGTNFLNLETKMEILFNKNGDVISLNGNSHKYKYDDKGKWILKNRSGYLIKRIIY